MKSSIKNTIKSNKTIKKIIISIILSVIMVFCSACGNNNSYDIGHGTPGVVEKIEWSAYDDLLLKTNKETDIEKRSLLLHQAEDMIMETHAVIPIYYSGCSYLCKTDVKGFHAISLALPDFTRMYKEGENTLQIYVSGDTPTLDTVSGTSAELITFQTNLQEGLVRYDFNENIICGLAESYEVSDDQLTYTFHLRDDLKWSDGNPLNADDFVYSWKRAAAKESGYDYGALFDCIEGYSEDLAIESANNGRDFIVKLHVPCPYFLQLLTFMPFYPVPEHIIRENDSVNISAWASTAPYISCGPYYVEEWVHNERMTLKKNPYYYAADEIKTDIFECMLTTDPSTVYAAYSADDLCLVFDNIPSDVLSEIKNDPEFHISPSLGTIYMEFNTKGSLFSGMTKEEASTFREAISYAIDREFISKVAVPGCGGPAVTLVPKNTQDSTGRTFGETCDGYDYPIKGLGYFYPQADLEKSRELLRSIGYEFDDSGKLKNPVTIEFMFASDPTNELVAACLQADLQQIGINLVLATREITVYTGEKTSGNYESAKAQWGLDFNDPYGMLQIYMTNGKNEPQFGK